MSNSSLITGTILTDNCNKPRNHKIDTITPHYMCWYCTGDVCCDSFVPPSRQASANYCIGKYGDIWLNVDEANRAWTTGSKSNDHRAITIECANHAETADGHVYGQLPNATWDSLVALCADICKRNGFKGVQYVGSADYSKLQNGYMLLTKHNWFQNTDCPGPWFDTQFDRLAKEINERLGITTETKKVVKSVVHINDIAAKIHYDMVTDARNGYSQYPHRWGGDHPDGSKTVIIDDKPYTYPLGSYDCSSSCIRAWQLALQYTPYKGALDDATYTGDIRSVFVNSGLFYADLKAAKRGDLYLSEGHHVAMCQDGGSDGVLGYDALSEFNRDENHSAYYGQVGDQDGLESVLRGYYDYPWGFVIHYNGKADYSIEETVEETIDETQEDNMMLIHPSDTDKIYYWDGSPECVPYHVSPAEKTAIEDAYKLTHGGITLKTVKMGQKNFDAIVNMCKARKAWHESELKKALGK